MHMFEYTSQVIAHERDAEIARAAEQRRVVLERLAATDAGPVAASGRPADRSRDVAGPGPLVAALRRALRPGVRTPRPLSVGRGTMAR